MVQADWSFSQSHTRAAYRRWAVFCGPWAGSAKAGGGPDGYSAGTKERPAMGLLLGGCRWPVMISAHAIAHGRAPKERDVGLRAPKEAPNTAGAAVEGQSSRPRCRQLVTLTLPNPPGWDSHGAWIARWLLAVWHAQAAHRREVPVAPPPCWMRALTWAIASRGPLSFPPPPSVAQRGLATVKPPQGHCRATWNGQNCLLTSPTRWSQSPRRSTCSTPSSCT